MVRATVTMHPPLWEGKEANHHVAAHQGPWAGEHEAKCPSQGAAKQRATRGTPQLKNRLSGAQEPIDVQPWQSASRTHRTRTQQTWAPPWPRMRYPPNTCNTRAPSGWVPPTKYQPYRPRTKKSSREKPIEGQGTMKPPSRHRPPTPKRGAQSRSCKTPPLNPKPWDQPQMEQAMAHYSNTHGSRLQQPTTPAPPLATIDEDPRDLLSMRHLEFFSSFWK